MAVASSGPYGSTEARNKLGNTVWTHSAAGQIVRQWVLPANPRTGSQLAVRAACREITARWQEVLTEQQRSAWYASPLRNRARNHVGEPIQLSAFQLYMRTNQVLWRILGIFNDTPPFPSDTSALEPLNTNAFPNLPATMTITWSPALDANHSLLLYATRDQSPGTRQPHYSITFINAYTGAGLTTVNAYDDYTSKYPQTTSNRRVITNAKLLNRTTGELSRPLRSDMLTIGEPDLLKSLTTTVPFLSSAGCGVKCVCVMFGPPLAH